MMIRIKTYVGIHLTIQFFSKTNNNQFMEC